MKVKISSWKDLKAGDVWLGLTYQPFHGDGSLDQEWDSAWFGSGTWIRHDTIDDLIAAGNNEVERKPEKVEFEGVADYGPATGTFKVEAVRAEIEPLIGQKVRVTIEPLD